MLSKLAAISTTNSSVGDQTINQVFGQLSSNQNMNSSSDNPELEYNVMDRKKSMELKGNQLTRSPDEFKQLNQRLPIKNPYSKNKSVNTDSGEQYKDFPGMFNLPVPTPATIKHLGTGNGQGSPIISRNQIKSASSAYDKSRELNAFGETLTHKRDSLTQTAHRLAETPAKWLSGLGPVGFTHTMSKKGPWTGALAGAGALGGAGLLGAWLHNKLSEPKYKVDEYGNVLFDEEGNPIEDTEEQDKRYWRYGAIGALAGGLLGHSFGTERKNFEPKETPKPSIEKKASTFIGGNGINEMNNILFQINNKIMGDMNMNFDQKRQLMTYVQTLPKPALFDLYPLLGTASGGGIGYLIAKKLLGLGFTGTILTTILGASAGLATGIFMQNNSIPTFDPFGGQSLVDYNGNRF